jgi:hypothetical protein
VIDSVDRSQALKRTALGSDSYTVTRRALAERLAAFEARKELPSSTDLPVGA